MGPAGHRGWAEGPGPYPAPICTLCGGESVGVGPALQSGAFAFSSQLCPLCEGLTPLPPPPGPCGSHKAASSCERCFVPTCPLPPHSAFCVARLMAGPTRVSKCPLLPTPVISRSLQAPPWPAVSSSPRPPCLFPPLPLRAGGAHCLWESLLAQRHPLGLRKPFHSVLSLGRASGS